MVAVLSAPETARVDLARAVRDRGALVLRDAARDVDGFALLAARMGSVRQDIACSAGPRARVRDGVFTANEAPPDQYICIHHEMAQCEHPPEFVLFYCGPPPPTAGALRASARPRCAQTFTGASRASSSGCARRGSDTVACSRRTQTTRQP